MTWSARVAQRALLSSRGCRLPGDELGVSRVGNRDRQPRLAGGRAEVLVKTRDAGNPSIECLRRRVAGNEIVAEGVNNLDRGQDSKRLPARHPYLKATG